VIVTRALLEKLFSSFSLPLPDEFKTPNSLYLAPNDTLPSSVNEEDLAYIGAFVMFAGISISSTDLAAAGFADTGMAHSFDNSMPITSKSGNGWIGIETVLVRLNSFYADNTSFPVWGNRPVVAGSKFYDTIGYDAAVCVEMYEPWIVQIYNSSLGVPTTMTIVSKSATTDFESDYVGYAGSFSFERC